MSVCENGACLCFEVKKLDKDKWLKSHDEKLIMLDLFNYKAKEIYKMAPFSRWCWGGAGEDKYEVQNV